MQYSYASCSPAAAYDAKTKYFWLAGAMILMQEAGDAQTVLDWGQAWLADSPRDSRARDVTVAMALAHCDLAAARLQADPTASLECYDSMQGALKLLKQRNAGQQLQADIQTAMQVASHITLGEIVGCASQCPGDGWIKKLRSCLLSVCLCSCFLRCSRLSVPRVAFIVDLT